MRAGIPKLYLLGGPGYKPQLQHHLIGCNRGSKVAGLPAVGRPDRERVARARNAAS